MRHAKGNSKLGKATDQRLAMLRSIVSSLIKTGKVKITQTRAKEARKMAEKVITLAKYKDVASRRRVISIIHNKEAADKLFKEVAAKYEGRPGGYTRMIKIGFRRGDGSSLVLLELV